jgi:uncharacterized protein (TIGR01777 family)
MQTILITGGTGLVGKKLSSLLSSKGYKVIILTRGLPKTTSENKLEYALWDVKRQTIDVSALQKADYIVHLAGAGVVDRKWTEAYKKEIEESRTLSSKLLINTLREHPHHVKAIISSSAIGWYGEDKKPGEAFAEGAAPDSSFLGITCKLWEESIEPASDMGIRVCKLRTGIVLSNDGGALAEFKKPIKLGVAGILGSGRQMVSWIHIDDLCRMFIYAIENSTLQGSYNAVAPSPVSNKELTLKLASLMKGKFFIPLHVPSIVLRIMMGNRSVEVLKSCNVSCDKIRKTGFDFSYPTIDSALSALVGKKQS